MPQIIQPKRSRRPLYIAIAVAVVVLLVVGYVVWRLVPSATTTVKQADALNLQGNYTQAYAKLKSAYGRAVTNGDKALILSRLAGTAYALDQKEQALKYYEELNRRSPHGYATLTSMGDIATELGHKDVAISAYKEALQIEKDGPKHERTAAEIVRLSELIDELEKSQ